MQVLPDYRKSVYNVPHTILNHFGIRTGRALGGFAGGDRAILILIDAMGTYLLSHLNTSNFSVDELTSTFPSTTAAAVTSIFTSLSPREHGILEWYMLYECTGSVIKTIPFTPMDSDLQDSLVDECDPSSLFGLPTIFDTLSRRGVRSSAYLKKEYTNSIYSRFMTRGARSIGFGEESEIPKLIRKDDSDFIYIYIDTVDSTQHRYGPGSEEVARELKRIWKIIEKVVEIKGDYDVFVTADHGQIEIKHRKILELPENCQVGGSPRDPFIYCDYLPDGYSALNSEEFVELLGPQDAPEHRNLRMRLPRYVLQPEDNTGAWLSEFSVSGLHGGMSRDEMLVPLLHHSR